MDVNKIQFKGKRLDTGEEVYGYLVCDTYIYGHKDFRAYIINHGHPSSCFGRDIYIEVDPATVCQYTGWDDKYGSPIFEGDILEFDLGEDFDGTPLGPCRCEVLWDRDGLKLKEKGYEAEPMDSIPDDAEIVGTIYDNH